MEIKSKKLKNALKFRIYIFAVRIIQNQTQLPNRFTAMGTISHPHRKSIRLREYDYSLPGEYFITICAHNRECIFGNIIQEEMMLSTEGMIIQRCWGEIPKHFLNVQLDEYIIMPNHIHGIIILTEPMVGTRQAVSLREQFAKPVRGSIPTIVRSFKSAATKRIHEICNKRSSPIWQSRFFDRIIRNDRELNNINDYILNNVFQWTVEKGDPDNNPLW
jgi:putative transposase